MKYLIILMFLYSYLFATCSVSTSCESSLESMSQSIKDKIDTEFDKLDDKIDETNEKYKVVLKELDKEIYDLKVALKGETLLYYKLFQIELLAKQSFHIIDIDISMIHNISSSYSHLQKKQGEKNEDR